MPDGTGEGFAGPMGLCDWLMDGHASVELVLVPMDIIACSTCKSLTPIRSMRLKLTGQPGPSGRYNPGRCRSGTGFKLAMRRRRVGWYPTRIGPTEPQPQGQSSGGPRSAHDAGAFDNERADCGSMNGVSNGYHPTRRLRAAHRNPVPGGPARVLPARWACAIGWSDGLASVKHVRLPKRLFRWPT